MPAPTTFTLSVEQYEALISLAQRGTVGPDGCVNQAQAVVLQAALQDIETSNGITRYSLWIQWQDPTAPLPPGTNFPTSWPPSLRYFLQFISRPICQQDVLDVVSQRTPNAVNIMVTPDPAALLGWTPIAGYFVQP
jgi:hypothetical protein